MHHGQRRHKRESPSAGGLKGGFGVGFRTSLSYSLKPRSSGWLNGEFGVGLTTVLYNLAAILQSCKTVLQHAALHPSTLHPNRPAASSTVPAQSTVDDSPAPWEVMAEA